MSMITTPQELHGGPQELHNYTHNTPGIAQLHLSEDETGRGCSPVQFLWCCDHRHCFLLFHLKFRIFAIFVVVQKRNMLPFSTKIKALPFFCLVFSNSRRLPSTIKRSESFDVLRASFIAK